MAQQLDKHVVKDDETIESIAKKYNITVAELQEANPDIEMFFYAGLKLNIPRQPNNVITPPNTKDEVKKEIHPQSTNNSSSLVSSNKNTNKSDDNTSDYNALLSEYTKEFNDTVLYKIKTYYETFKDEARKREAKSLIYKEIISILENGEKDVALSLVNLYQDITDDADENLPTLLFIKGNICAEMSDGSNLEQVICDLENSVYRDQETVINYISSLKNLQVKYISVYKKLDGIWVADDLFWYGWKKNRINNSLPKRSPDMISTIKYDLNADTLSFCISGHSSISSEILFDMEKKEQIVNYPQLVIPFASDSLYLLWSSEKLNRNSPELAPLFRGAVTGIAAGVSAEFAQNNKYNFGEQLLSGTLTTIAEVGLNAVISAIFTPTTRMYALEARLKVENEYLLTGTLTYQYIWIAADGTVYENKAMKSNVKLVRWMPESNVAFTNSWFMPIFHPTHEKIYGDFLERETKTEKIKKPKQYEMAVDEFFKNKDFRYAYCKSKIGKVKMFSYSKTAISYNNDQYKWLQLYNDSILRSRGYKGKYAIPDNAIPYIGLQYDVLPEKIRKKNKEVGTNGVYVIGVFEDSPAYVAGLQEKDIILRVEDTDVKDIMEMKSILDNKRIGDWIKFQVLRKKEILDLSLRVLW